MSPLFESTPLDFTKPTAISDIKNNEDFKKNSRLSLREYEIFLNFCLDSSYIHYNNTAYQQEKDIPMRSPDSVVIA